MTYRKLLVIGSFLLAVGISFVLVAETVRFTYWHVNIKKIFLGTIIPLPILTAGLMFVITGLLEWKFPKKNTD